MSEHMCPACGRFRLRRSGRRTFAERFFYPLFGKYPWACKGCRVRVVYRDRGGVTTGHKRRVPNSPPSDSHAAASTV
jgi:hypothetical protein